MKRQAESTFFSYSLSFINGPVCLLSFHYHNFYHIFTWKYNVMEMYFIGVETGCRVKEKNECNYRRRERVIYRYGVHIASPEDFHVRYRWVGKCHHIWTGPVTLYLVSSRWLALGLLPFRLVNIWPSVYSKSGVSISGLWDSDKHMSWHPVLCIIEHVILVFICWAILNGIILFQTHKHIWKVPWKIKLIYILINVTYIDPCCILKDMTLVIYLHTYLVTSFDSYCILAWCNVWCIFTKHGITNLSYKTLCL